MKYSTNNKQWGCFLYEDLESFPNIMLFEKSRVKNSVKFFLYKSRRGLKYMFVFGIFA